MSAVATSLTVAALMLCAAPACADVLEIGDGGAVRVRAGVGAVAWSGEADVEPAPDVPAAAVTLIATPAAPAPYRQALVAAATGAGVSPTLLAALIRRESGWRSAAVSPKGAVGLAQLMPATARALAVDPRDPTSALAAGARYLRSMLDRFDGDVERGLAAYNAGPARVARAGGVPAIAETQAYVSTILAGLGEIHAQGGTR